VYATTERPLYSCLGELELGFEYQVHHLNFLNVFVLVVVKYYIYFAV
jgi:hypothetical protein